MEAARITLSMMFTALGASIVVSLMWYLIESLKYPEAETARERQLRHSAQVLAAGIAAFMGGLLCSQFYMLIAARYYFGATSPTPILPLAAAAAVFAIGGAATNAWMLRPRRVPGWMWGLSIFAASGGLILARIFWL